MFCHDYPVGRFVNGLEAVYGDFSQSGVLAALLAERHDLFGENALADRRRWGYAKNTFGWAALAPKYREMFHAAADGPRRA